MHSTSTQCDSAPVQPSSFVQDRLRAGFALHQQGRLAEAAEIYQEILSINPRHYESLYFLGMTQTGNPEKAIGLIAKAIELAPPTALFHFSHAALLQHLGRLDEALVHYDTATRLKPDYAEAFHNRGNILFDLKRADEALASYERAIQLKPDFAEGHLSRGIALRELKRANEALASFDRAIELKPDYAESHYNRGIVLRDLNFLSEALASHDKAIALKPDYAEAWNNQGVVLNDLKRFDEAIARYDRAIALNPGLAYAYCNRGAALEALGLLDEALANYDKATQLKPDFANAWSNRGVVLHHLGRPDDALASYEKALVLEPDNAEAHKNKSFVELITGKWDRGWKSYEWRKKSIETLRSGNFPVPLLTSLEQARGKTVLVYWEQGLGDTIQFCRYLKPLRQAGARVLFAPQPQLKFLLNSLGDGIEFADPKTLSFDYHIPLMSLPLLFGTTLESVPAEVPYLFANGDLVRKWFARLGSGGFKVGICWKGASTYRDDVNRSLPVAWFEMLADIPEVRLISLHKGDGEGQLKSLPEGMTIETLGRNFDAGPNAFADTAAVMKCLDLVITSDSAVAHLAGALGVPTWLTLQHVPEWRWLQGRLDSIWYPSLRLFRQKTRGDWQAVFEEIRKELTVAAGEAQVSATQLAPISWGELLDKITILEIKLARLVDSAAQANVRKELELLHAVAEKHLLAGEKIRPKKTLLTQINQTLWDIEDRIREKEKPGSSTRNSSASPGRFTKPTTREPPSSVKSTCCWARISWKKKAILANGARTDVRDPPASIPHRSAGHDCIGRNAAWIPFPAKARSFPLH